MDPDTDLKKIAGIGPALAAKLEKLNLHTVSDLLHHYPFRYDDFSQIKKISEVKVGEVVSIQGQIWQIKNAFTRNHKVITKALLNDGTGSIELTWYNQPYLTKSILTGTTLSVAGKVDTYNQKPTMITPEWEKADQLLHTGRLVPIYPETTGLSSKWLRTLIYRLLPQVLPQLSDPIPEEVREGFIDLPLALDQIHFPQNFPQAFEARKRLAFDELFFIQLATQQIRRLWEEKTTVKPWLINPTNVQEFTSSLPFDLTAAQNRVISEVIADLKKESPMNRLVQGEVGSGKTIVAATAIYLAFKNNVTSLFMAPTEILAFQHYETLKKVLEPLGLSLGIYTGSRKAVGGSALRATPNLIVGTHALLSEKFNPENVGLVVIDEQHRFGVEQRTLLRQKGPAPHLLSMTATPIPRTVALTLYGDLDLSIIDELPKNRQQVKTHLVPENKRFDAYGFIEKKVKEGDQVYIITPLIEESASPTVAAKAAKVEYENLQKIFSTLSLGLLHGRMKSKEKDEVLTKFREGEIAILVSTSVVEVGVDVPNATVMVIEGAEKFGLAQLHQLRGRVGRGAKQSFCLLFTTSLEDNESTRLKYLESTFDGLKLAELDLRMRGSGQIFGVSQHGRFDLKLAKFTDTQLIEQASSTAHKILQSDSTLDKYPLLQAKLLNLAAKVMPD